MDKRASPITLAGAMIAPLLTLTLLGLLAAWSHHTPATYALGSWTFPLAIAAPAIVAGRMLQSGRCALRTTLACLGAITLNLTIEAAGTSAQLALLHL